MQVTEFDQLVLFKSIKVTGQVAVGRVQQFLQGDEINRIIYHEYRHNPQPYAALELLV